MEILTSQKRAAAKTRFLQQKRPFLNKKSLADMQGFCAPEAGLEPATL
jgi:hypothetical protein